MKKYINCTFLFLIFYFIFNINCYASTNTFIRTDNNLRIPIDVVADSNNHDDIMNTPSVDATEKVYDFAELLSPDEEKEIYNKIIEYNKESSYDAVVVTTNDLLGKDLSKYVYDFYDYNDFKNEGVIFVIYVGHGEPGMYMGVCAPKGSNYFDLYNNSIVKSTSDYLYKNSIRKNNYYEGCYNFVKIVHGLYIQGQNESSYIGENGEIVQTIPIFEILVIAFALTFIIMFILIKITSKKNNFKYNISDNINDETLSIICDYDKLVEK